MDQLIINLESGCEFVHLKKGEVAFKKGEEHKNHVYVLMNTALKGATTEYPSNSVLHKQELL